LLSCTCPNRHPTLIEMPARIRRVKRQTEPGERKAQAQPRLPAEKISDFSAGRIQPGFGSEHRLAGNRSQSPVRARQWTAAKLFCQRVSVC
jgi:hypothetical protein